MSDLLPQLVASALYLVASATWYLRTFRYGILVTFSYVRLGRLGYETVGVLVTWDLSCLSWLPPLYVKSLVASARSFHSVRPLSPHLVASVTWYLCHFSWSSLLRGTFVALIDRFRYVGPLSPQLITSALREILITSAMGPWSLLLRGSLYLATWEPRICYVTFAMCNLIPSLRRRRYTHLSPTGLA